MLKKLLDYSFHYRKFGKAGIDLLKKINEKKSEIFSVKLRDIKFPFYLRGGTSDIPTFYQIFSTKEYKINYFFEPKYIVDLGANIGLASIYFKNIFPDSTIIAVEPDASNFEMLQKNTRPYQNIHCLQCGVWNKNTNLEILDIGKGKWAFVVKETDAENTHSVKAMTVGEIINRFEIPSIDILKIDIESAEKELFESNYEEWLPKVKTMIVELHDRYKEGCSKAFFKTMSEYDFSTRLRGENIICDMTSKQTSEFQK